MYLNDLLHLIILDDRVVYVNNAQVIHLKNQLLRRYSGALPRHFLGQVLIRKPHVSSTALIPKMFSVA